MKQIKFKRWSYLLMLAGFFTFSACEREDLLIENERERLLRNAAEFLRNNYDFSLFNAAIEWVGMDESLRDNEADYTIFAPTNAAFNSIGVEFPSDFEKMDRDSLRFMLEYHILPSAVYLSDIGYEQADQLQENLTGRQLHLGRPAQPSTGVGGQFYVNGIQSRANNNNVNLSNGVLHGLDQVLRYRSGSVRDYLEALPEYRNFVALLKRFDYWDMLDEDRNWTIYALSNTVLENRGLSLDAIAELNVAEYDADLLLSVYLHPDQHLFTSDWLVVEARGGVFRRTRYGIYSIDMSGGRITVRVYPSTNTAVRVVQVSNTATNYQVDYKADNGVIHGLGGMVVLPDEAKL
ncbi:Fasciclin domain-containing protein [Parapedobacter composti]|uniref:Fasciclin domain-containing protein n=1 Tax=Parapedobacter composti TaxID=623281 RepID=A0A1I1M742_9SPHI|nr:fasciclin domain-containing protein [Parapedobacter composti]SFC78393.1 Fasciclin domain-containing protein [Parapedobacter composti]